jgi:transcriptional regulator with XRE-family HTH domain
MNALSWPALIREARTLAGLTQRDLAARAQTTQSAIGRIEAGLGNPNVRTIERLLAAAGFRLHFELRPLSDKDPIIAAYKAGIDRTLLRENLKKTPDQRVRALQALARLADEARRAGKTLRRRQ